VHELKQPLVRGEASVFGIALKKEPHSLEENRFVLVGRVVDEEGKKETMISLGHDKKINWQLKISGKERRLAGLKEDVFLRFSADFSLDGELIKIRSESVGRYADYINKERLEKELRRVIQTPIGGEWLESDLKGLERRGFVAKPLG